MLIYINDFHASSSLNLISFADDTTVYACGHDLDNLTRYINSELANLYTWLCSNRLSLNIEKTKFLIFCPPGYKYHSQNIHVTINNLQLTQIGNTFSEKFIKFLGNHLDQNLNWAAHINYLRNKIIKVIYVINRVKFLLPHSALKTLYLTLIHPYLTYGILARGNSQHVNRLLLLQKKILRIINNKSYRSHTEPLFRSEGILRVDDLYTYNVLLFMHDLKHEHLPLSFKNFIPINRNVINRTTRQSDLFYVARPRTKYTSKLPIHHLPKVWNSFAEEKRSTFNRKSFKAECKQHLLENYSINYTCDNRMCRECNVQQVSNQ